MLTLKSIYGITAINLFILLPLLTETLIMNWSFSFSQLACFICPSITLFMVFRLIQSELLKTVHGTINLIAQILIGSTAIIINPFR